MLKLLLKITVLSSLALSLVACSNNPLSSADAVSEDVVTAKLPSGIQQYSEFIVFFDNSVYIDKKNQTKTLTTFVNKNYTATRTDDNNVKYVVTYAADLVRGVAKAGNSNPNVTITSKSLKIGANSTITLKANQDKVNVPRKTFGVKLRAKVTSCVKQSRQ